MYRRLDQKATGEQLRTMAESKGITAYDIQKQMGFKSPASVYNWFLGRRTPTVEHFLELSRLFGVSVNEMCFFQE